MPNPINVILLTSEDCRFCHDAEEILIRLSRDFALEIVTIGIDTSEGSHLAMSGGVLFPPGLYIEGAPFSFGRPSERKLRKRFEALASRREAAS